MLKVKIEDEPPTAKPNLAKQDAMEQKDRLVSDLQATGYTREEAEEAVESSKKMEDPLFSTPIAEGKGKEKVVFTQGSSHKTGLKLKLNKGKGPVKMESKSVANTVSDICKATDTSGEVTVAEEKEAWKLMDQFLAAAAYKYPN